MIRGAGHLIRMGEDDPARKFYQSNIYGEKEDIADFVSDGAMPLRHPY